MFDRILVPLDGSGLARQVFPAVVDLSKAFDSEVVLVGVCEPETSEYGKECRLYLNNEAEQLRKNMAGSAANIKSVVLTGRPAEQITDYAAKNKNSLIIVSSHGRSGIVPWSLGSTVQKLLNKVGVPLIIVRVKEVPEESDKTGLFSRILMPLDGSEKGEAALPYVLELTRKLESEVILLRIVEPGRHVHSGIGGVSYIRFKDKDINSMKMSAQEYLNGVASKFAGTKAILKSEVGVGDAAKEIIKFANEKGCRLIAMASHGHSGIEIWMYGSITHKILQGSNQSVWLVLSPGIRK